jgi:hypothetical protein
MGQRHAQRDRQILQEVSLCSECLGECGAYRDRSHDGSSSLQTVTILNNQPKTDRGEAEWPVGDRGRSSWSGDSGSRFTTTIAPTESRASPKRRSAALRAGSVLTAIAAVLAAIGLVSLVLDQVLHIAWADAVGALIIAREHWALAASRSPESIVPAGG